MQGSGMGVLINDGDWKDFVIVVIKQHYNY